MFPEKYSVLVLGTPNSGVFEFCTYLASFYLRNDQSVLFVEVDTSRSLVKRQMRGYGTKIDEFDRNVFDIIDCYSQSQDSDNNGDECDPANLSDLLDKIAMSVNSMNEPVRIIFDSISSLYIYCDAGKVKDFIRRLIEVAKRHGSITSTLQEDLHSPEVVGEILEMNDGLIEMKVDEHFKRFIRVNRMKGERVEPKWIEFDIGQKEEEDGATLVWKKENEGAG